MAVDKTDEHARASPYKFTGTAHLRHLSLLFLRDDRSERTFASPLLESKPDRQSALSVNASRLQGSQARVGLSIEAEQPLHG